MVDNSASSLAAFLLTAAAISFSGVMAPGPMTAMTIGRGSRDARAGVLIALGHGIVEFPIMGAVLAGAGALFTLPYVKQAVGIGGGLVMLVMAVGLLRRHADPVAATRPDGRSPLVAGMVLTGGNPYFLVWWATVGASLVTGAAVFGAAGLALFSAVHWLCDLLWLALLSFMAAHGSRALGPRFNRTVSLVSGGAMVVFAGLFLYDSLATLMNVL